MEDLLFSGEKGYFDLKTEDGDFLPANGFESAIIFALFGPNVSQSANTQISNGYSWWGNFTDLDGTFSGSYEKLLLELAPIPANLELFQQAAVSDITDAIGSDYTVSSVCSVNKGLLINKIQITSNSGEILLNIEL